MHNARIRPEYRLIQGDSKHEVAQIAAPFLKDGWVALYEPLYGRPAAWVDKECWSQTLFRPGRPEPEKRSAKGRTSGR